MKNLTKLKKEAVDIETGKAAAAKVVEYVRKEDGSLERREVDPEEHRKEAARNFEIKSEVAKIRHTLNLTQQSFADRLGISVHTLRKWESNATQPSGAAKALLTIIKKRPEVIDLLTEDEKISA